MKRLQKTCILSGLLICGLGLGLPRVSYAVTGCTNAYLTGTYTAEVSSANFLNVLNSINNASAPSSTTGTSSSGGSTGSTSSSGGNNSIAENPNAGSGTSSGGSTGAVGTTTSAASSGFVNTPFSLSGAVPGTSRFYFDGNGNIVGSNPGSSTTSAIVGSYTVNTDCTANVSLNTGESFNGVVTNSGAQVLFMQNNASMGGAVGSLQRTSGNCLANSPTPQSFGFSFFGAQQVSSTSSTGTSSSGSTGSTGTTTANAVSFSPYGAVGQIDLNGSGGFTIKEWIYQNGANSLATGAGTYSVGGDCSLSLSFAAPNLTAVSGGTTGAVGSGTTITPITAPFTFRGALVNSTSGLIVIQPNSLSTITGTFVSQ